ncbi:MAG: hypothetical protein BGN92_08525 [Sphingobacteriales bacterium 41-5]|nr:MAG: hypothetical protein BGN92_08525 [Sphingobacteriales bacterium 41-5]
MTIVLNNAYVLKPDNGFAMILPKETVLDFNDPSVEFGFVSKIHPMHAAILSCFDGRSFDDALNIASETLNTSIDYIKKFVDSLTENQESVAYIYKNIMILFPKNCLVKSDTPRYDLPDISEFDLGEEERFETYRHNSPTDLIFMLTTRCATDCVYCYADRRRLIDCKVPFERIKELIIEARKLHMRSFNLIGGEVFLYKHWKELLIFLKKNHFDPAVSTKVPLTEEDVKFLSDIHVKAIQISLDTLLPAHLTDILGVKERYIGKLKESFRLLDKYNVKVFVHTVMTNKNDSLEDMESIFQYLKTLQNIVTWRIDKTTASLYKKVESYQAIKPSVEKLDQISSYLKDIQETENTQFKIVYSGIGDTGINEIYDADKRSTRFNKRAMCSGNKTSLFILPDGNVTICEELYWHKDFFLGNVLTQSLIEIWNSEKALNPYYLRKENIPVDSACHDCDIFEDCKFKLGTCFRDTIKCYGEDKWYYPDKYCPKAPLPLHEIIV